MLDHDAPNRVYIDIEIGMHEDVAHSDDARPRKFRYSSPARFGRPRRGLPNDLNALNQRTLQHVIAVEMLARSPVGKRDRVPRCKQHVLQAVTVSDFVVSLARTTALSVRLLRRHIAPLLRT